MRNLVIVAVLVLCFSTLTVAQELPRYEFFGGWTYVRPDGGVTNSSPTNGWNVAVTFNINEMVAVDIEGTGHYRRYTDDAALFEFAKAPLTRGSGEVYETQDEVNHILGPLDVNVHDPNVPYEDGYVDAGYDVLDNRGNTVSSQVSSRAHSVAFGPRITFRENERYQPFFRAMFGIKHTAIDVFQDSYPDYYRALNDDELAALDELDLGEEEYQEIVDAGVLVPASDNYDSAITDNIMLVFGGGLDIVINSKWSVRAFQTDYVLERQRGDFRPDLSFGAGIVLKVGEK